mmetsp:Transcript_124077/g.345352  ORF Transcript_124077/g.345352 Transcript_124077/m.345352 type:complete len:222 (-) Transcript_124077:1183-1848(-)
MALPAAAPFGQAEDGVGVVGDQWSLDVVLGAREQEVAMVVRMQQAPPQAVQVAAAYTQGLCRAARQHEEPQIHGVGREMLVRSPRLGYRLLHKTGPHDMPTTAAVQWAVAAERQRVVHQDKAPMPSNLFTPPAMAVPVPPHMLHRRIPSLAQGPVRQAQAHQCCAGGVQRLPGGEEGTDEITTCVLRNGCEACAKPAIPDAALLHICCHRSAVEEFPAAQR